jgi:hypothetical protein
MGLGDLCSQREQLKCISSVLESEVSIAIPDMKIIFCNTCVLCLGVFYYSTIVNPNTVLSQTSASDIQTLESDSSMDLPNEVRLIKQNASGVGGALPSKLRCVRGYNR